jgi:hypothetical protein
MLYDIKRIIIYIFFSSSILVGYAFDENASGGAKLDYNFFLPYLNLLSENFSNGINAYISNAGSSIHSPVFHIIISFIYKIIEDLEILRIIYIIISCFLPYLFYCILREKFNIHKNTLFIFSLVIFFSPYFRSSAIWLLGDNLSLIFFGLSIYFFNKFFLNKSKNLKNIFLCMFFLILCSYIRYYYCIFSIYYLFYFFKKISLKNFLLIIFFSLILSLPAIFYFFYIFLNFDFFITIKNYSKLNYYSNSLIILSIFLLYFLPFLILQKELFFKYLVEEKKIILLFFFIIFSFFILDFMFFENLINFSERGGGVFLKFSNMIMINTSLFLSTTTFFSIIIFDFYSLKKRVQNYFLLLFLILSFPIFTIYQKYFDPLFFLFFFGLITSKFHKKNLTKKSSVIFLLSYFLSFLSFSIIYYSNLNL